jgi:TRAP-type uncharacterized transport system fused permease subunit
MLPTYDEIRKLIERRYRRWVIFALHLSIFVFWFAVLGWWVITREPVPGDMQNLWIMAAWFAALIAHGFIVYMSNARDREIERAWERYGGKHKREMDDYPVYLSDDGELVDWTDEPGHRLDKSKRQA